MSFLPSPTALLDVAAEHAVLVCLLVFLAALGESALGVGVLVPGETVVLAAAVGLAGSPWLVVALGAAWVGAFVADHVGFAVGRHAGPALRDSRVVQWLGVERWQGAVDTVERRSGWILVGARLLPGVRTLVSAAAGASSLAYRRFVAVTALATLLWSGLWVLGGAVAGQALLRAGDARIVLPVVLGPLALVWVVRRLRATQPATGSDTGSSASGSSATGASCSLRS